MRVYGHSSDPRFDIRNKPTRKKTTFTFKSKVFLKSPQTESQDPEMIWGEQRLELSLILRHPTIRPSRGGSTSVRGGSIKVSKGGHGWAAAEAALSLTLQRCRTIHLCQRSPPVQRASPLKAIGHVDAPPHADSPPGHGTALVG